MKKLLAKFSFLGLAALFSSTVVNCNSHPTDECIQSYKDFLEQRNQDYAKMYPTVTHPLITNIRVIPSSYENCQVSDEILWDEETGTPPNEKLAKDQSKVCCYNRNVNVVKM